MIDFSMPMDDNQPEAAAVGRRPTSRPPHCEERALVEVTANYRNYLLVQLTEYLNVPVTHM